MWALIVRGIFVKETSACLSFIMGPCASNLSPEDEDLKKKGKAIDRAMRDLAVQNEQKVKLLLLGAGESGKSTIFKQMKLIYGNKYTPAELKTFSNTVYANIMQTMSILLHQCPVDMLDDLRQHYAAQVALVLAYDVGMELDVALGTAVQELWASKVVQEMWRRKSEFHSVGECMIYYMDCLNKIMQPDYVPTETDVLNSRVKTTGIVTENYTIDGQHLRDVRCRRAAERAQEVDPLFRRGDCRNIRRSLVRV